MSATQFPPAPNESHPQVFRPAGTLRSAVSPAAQARQPAHGYPSQHAGRRFGNRLVPLRTTSLPTTLIANELPSVASTRPSTTLLNIPVIASLEDSTVKLSSGEVRSVAIDRADHQRAAEGQGKRATFSQPVILCALVESANLEFAAPRSSPASGRR